MSNLKRRAVDRTVKRLAVLTFLLYGCEFGGGPGPLAQPLQMPDSAFPNLPDSGSGSNGSGSNGSGSNGSGSNGSGSNGSGSNGSGSNGSGSNGSGSNGSGSNGSGSTEHLLLTEVCLGPTGAEFVEIYNPISVPEDLSQYFLANHGSYWQLPAGAPSLPSAHFIVQFPAGASIGPGQVITVATGSTAAFQAAYGVPPDFSIADGTMTMTDVSGSPSLTDTGAFISLFEWDGTEALVHDVDLMIVGQPNQTNLPISKSGVSQGGRTYATDTNLLAPQTATPGGGQSTKRIAAENGHEIQNGNGNGITGHDETSENTNVTWDSVFTAPTPGHLF